MENGKRETQERDWGWGAVYGGDGEGGMAWAKGPEIVARGKISTTCPESLTVAAAAEVVDGS